MDAALLVSMLGSSLLLSDCLVCLSSENLTV